MPSAVPDEDLRCDVWKPLDAERRGPTWNPDLNESKHSILGSDTRKPRAVAEVRGRGLG